MSTRILASFTCDSCGPVEVSLVVPAGTTLADVAEHLDDVTFESSVVHELTEHLDGLVAP